MNTTGYKLLCRDLVGQEQTGVEFYATAGSVKVVIIKFGFETHLTMTVDDVRDFMQSLTIAQDVALKRKELTDEQP